MNARTDRANQHYYCYLSLACLPACLPVCLTMEKKTHMLDMLIRGAVTKRADTQTESEEEEEEEEDIFVDAPEFDPGPEASSTERHEARAVADYFLDMRDTFTTIARGLTPIDLSNFYASDPQFSRLPAFRRAFRAAWIALLSRDWRNPFTGKPYANMAQYGEDVDWPLVASAWQVNARLVVLGWYSFWDGLSTAVNTLSLPIPGYGNGPLVVELQQPRDARAPTTERAFFHAEHDLDNMDFDHSRRPYNVDRSTAMIASTRPCCQTGDDMAWEDVYVVARYTAPVDIYAQVAGRGERFVDAARTPAFLESMCAQLLSSPDVRSIRTTIEDRTRWTPDGTSTAGEPVPVKLVPAPPAAQRVWEARVADMKRRLVPERARAAYDMTPLGYYYLVAVDQPATPLCDLGVVWSTNWGAQRHVIGLYTVHVDALAWPVSALTPDEGDFRFRHPSLDATFVNQRLAKLEAFKRIVLRQFITPAQWRPTATADTYTVLEMMGELTSAPVDAKRALVYLRAREGCS